MSRLEAARHSYAWARDREVLGPFGIPDKAWTPYRWFKQHRKYNDRTKFCLGVRDKENGRVIGYEAVELLSGGTAILTVMIGDRSYWGKGVVLETRRAVLDFLFDHTTCRRAWGSPSASNLPSIFNYHALGFVAEGTLRKHGVHYQSGEPTDHVVFGLLREEWLDQRQPRAA